MKLNINSFWRAYADMSSVEALPAAYAAEMPSEGKGTYGLPGHRCRPYYELTLWVSPDRGELRDRYAAALAKHNALTMAYIAGGRVDWNAGFDLFVPESTRAQGGGTLVLDHRVRAAMCRVEPSDGGLDVKTVAGRLVLAPSDADKTPVSYYLYPRSSMGTRTPLRLANSVGIIDSGYRGNIKAILDHVKPIRGPFTVGLHTRLVQICPPELTAPIYVRLIDDRRELGETVRGEGGLGSTGE